MAFGASNQYYPSFLTLCSCTRVKCQIFTLTLESAILKDSSRPQTAIPLSRELTLITTQKFSASLNRDVNVNTANKN